MVKKPHSPDWRLVGSADCSVRLRWPTFGSDFVPKFSEITVRLATVPSTHCVYTTLTWTAPLVGCWNLTTPVVVPTWVPLCGVTITYFWAPPVVTTLPLPEVPFPLVELCRATDGTLCGQFRCNRKHWAKFWDLHVSNACSRLWHLWHSRYCRWCWICNRCINVAVCTACTRTLRRCYWWSVTSLNHGLMQSQP